MPKQLIKAKIYDNQGKYHGIRLVTKKEALKRHTAEGYIISCKAPFRDIKNNPIFSYRILRLYLYNTRGIDAKISGMVYFGKMTPHSRQPEFYVERLNSEALIKQIPFIAPLKVWLEAGAYIGGNYLTNHQLINTHDIIYS